MHFKWKDRATGKVEDDLIIFPDDIEYKKVAQCTTGRVFVLKFTITSRRMFFWMQVEGILQPNSWARDDRFPDLIENCSLISFFSCPEF